MCLEKLLSWFEVAAKIWILRILSFMFIVSGIILFPLPIPFGLIFIITGLMLLVSSNRQLANYFKNYRKNHPEVDQKIRQIKEKIPSIIRKPLEITEPESD